MIHDDTWWYMMIHDDTWWYQVHPKFIRSSEVHPRMGSIGMGSSSPCRASNMTWGPVPLQAVGLAQFGEITWNLKSDFSLSEQVLFHQQGTRKRASATTLSLSGLDVASLFRLCSGCSLFRSFDGIYFNLRKDFQDVPNAVSKALPLQTCFRHVKWLSSAFYLVCLRFHFRVSEYHCVTFEILKVFEQCLKIFLCLFCTSKIKTFVLTSCKSKMCISTQYLHHIIISSSNLHQIFIISSSYLHHIFIISWNLHHIFISSSYLHHIFISSLNFSLYL